MNTTISGHCWTCGDDVTVYQIVAEAHWTMKKLDGEAMGDWVFETLEDSACCTPGAFRRMGCEIVVAGECFGCGSKSVEHPMAALKGAGVKLIIAQSVSRYSYRNAINLALPVLICPNAKELFHRGDRLTADFVSGKIYNQTTNRTACVDGLGDFATGIIASGGLIEYVMKEQKNNEK